MSQPLFFRIFSNDTLVGVKQFDQDQVIVGSKPESDIFADSSDVAPIHALIEKRGEDYYLCDLGSESGTFLNETKVLDTRLQSGDTFKVGSFKVEFFIGIPKPQKKPPQVSANPPEPPKEEDSVYSSSVGEKKETLLDTLPPEPPKEEDSKSKDNSVNKIEPPPVKIAPDKEDFEPENAFEEKTENKPATQIEEVPISTKPEIREVHPPQPKNSDEVDNKIQEQPLRKDQIISQGTFAPEENIAPIDERIKPTKGSVVEVMSCWGNRVLDTFHFQNRATVTVGSHPKNDIILPVIGGANLSHPLLKIDSDAVVFLTADMKGFVQRKNNKVSLDKIMHGGGAVRSGAGYLVKLNQGEVLKLEFGNGISIFVRYVSQSPKPLMLPFLNLSAGEMTAIVLIICFIGLFGLYMTIYSDPPIEEKVEEQKRIATFTYKKRTPIKPVTQAPKIQSQQSERKEVKKVQLEKKGKASPAPKTRSKSTKKVLTAKKKGTSKGIRRQGVKKSNAEQGVAKAPKRDIRKSGLLSAFGSKGAQEKLQKAIDGAGSAQGASQRATGAGAKSAAGSGVIPGGGLKTLGQGGSGESTVGVGDVKTRGKGGGDSGYGSGTLGTKSNATIVPGGAEESFTAGIDKEAIRRVIQENLRQVRSCYELGLNKNPNLYGKVVVKWTIGAKGRVTQAGINSTTLKNSEVEKCIVNRFRTWNFPAPPDDLEAVVMYPFVLDSR